MLGDLLSNAATTQAVEKGKFIIFNKGAKDDEIEVLFNPNEYTLTTTGTLGCKKEGSPGMLQFTNVKKDDFVLDLWFDTYGTPEDVRSAANFNKFVNLVNPSEETKNMAVPKVCLFSWGGEVFKGIVTKVKQNFILFDRKGTPKRCKLTLTMTPVLSSKELDKAYGKDQCRKVTFIQKGERLDFVAYRTLHDPSLWRELVYENPDLIKNPRRYPAEHFTGKNLAVPDYYDSTGNKNG